MIHFARYVPMVAALGARVILEVPGAIHSLMLGMSGVTHGVPRGFPMMPAFDVHCPLSSLPLAFRTRLETIPAPVAYLPPFRRRAARNGKAGLDRTIASASASCGPATGITRTITTGR